MGEGQCRSRNNHQHTKLNWCKIDTNVASLIAMVDFSLTPSAAKDSAVNNPSKRNDELKLLPDSLVKPVKRDSGKLPEKQKTSLSNSETTSNKKDTNHDSSRLWIYGLVGLGVLGGIVIAIKRKKR